MIPRYNKSRDSTEPDIVRALQAHGATVIRSDRVDLIVGYHGKNFLLKVKRDHAAKLKPSQIEMVRTWGGQYSIVTTAEESLDAIGVKR